MISPNPLQIQEIAAYQRDAEDSLRLLFAVGRSNYDSRFVGKTSKEVDALLALRIEETEIRSSLIIMASIEASFRLDFLFRCKAKLKDELSRHFRRIEQSSGARIRFDEDILEGWKTYAPASTRLIGEIRAAINYRHWLAHGRYWVPKLGRMYDYFYLQALGEQVEGTFDLKA